jgi:rubrerythrin
MTTFRSESPKLRLHYFLCELCGYGVAVKALPAACPMCRGSRWLALDVERRLR